MDQPDWYCDEVIPGQSRVEVLIDSEEALAFHPDRPRFGAEHVIVVPKRHVGSLLELEAADASGLLSVILQALWAWSHVPAVHRELHCPDDDHQARCDRAAACRDPATALLGRRKRVEQLLRTRSESHHQQRGRGPWPRPATTPQP